MGIAALSVATGATVSTTGGTAVAVAVKDRASNEVTLAATADALATQRSFTFSVVRPKPDSSNPTKYTQARRKVVMRVPVDLGSGVINVDVCSIEISTGQATSAASILDYRKMLAQSLIDTDLDGFFANQLVD